MQVTLGSPQRHHSLMFTCSKGKGQAGTSPCAALALGALPTFPLHSSGSPGCGAGGSRIPQELTLLVTEALGAMAAPSGPAAVLDEPHLPITPIFPSHPHGSTS